jgi:transitional endoplasmic reticulum ATPase
MASWPRGVSDFGIRGLLWVAVASVFLLSYLLYTPPSAAHGGEGPADWIFRSWPALFAAALAMWLLLKGRAGSAHPLVRKACQLAMFFFLYSGILYVLKWNPFWNWMFALGFENRNKTEGFLILVSTLAWLGVTLRVLFGGSGLPSLGFGIRALGTRAPEMKTTRPATTFADIGGMEEAKQQIREIVENRLHPGKFGQYGVVRNGILLYGPRGSGKTFLAEATAGEFKLNYRYIKGSELLSMWVGQTEEHLRNTVSAAVSSRPILIFFDEIDVLGATRNTGISPTTGTRSWNNITIQLMQCIDQYRSKPGLIFMAATNLLEGLDPALIREGRFDVQIRLDMPDEATRKGIFEAQLKQKPWKPCNLEEFARRTPGASAAKIKSIVDRAAVVAAQEGRRIEDRDLRKALDETGGRDRPLFKPVQWEDLIVEPEVERELRALVKQMNAGWSELRSMAVPTGVLLVGPPGTGKTMIGRLIATQTRRSFYPLSAADVLGGQVGASVKKLSEIFARARENSPSIIFFDEIDGLLPWNTGLLSTHDTQVVEQCRTEISQLEAEHNVFLIGTTNHLDRIDPAIIRGGRFSEKIEITAPGQANRERLLKAYLKDIKLDIQIDRIAERLAGLAPADIEAVCKSAVRRAFGRNDRDDSIPPLIWDDFEHAIKRVVHYSF